jgi:hypothetical protein
VPEVGHRGRRSGAPRRPSRPVPAAIFSSSFHFFPYKYSGVHTQHNNETEPAAVFNNEFLRRLSHISFSPVLERFGRRITKNGVKEIEQFRKYADGGVRMFIAHTAHNAWLGDASPTDCGGSCEFLTNACPKLGYLCGILADVVLEKREILVLPRRMAHGHVDDRDVTGTP